MERRPDSGSISDAIEEVTRTMIGESAEQNNPAGQWTQRAQTETKYTPVDVSPQAGEPGPGLEDTVPRRPIRLRTLARAVNAEMRKREAEMFLRRSTDKPESLRGRLAELFEGGFKYVFDEDDSLLPKQDETDFGRAIRRGREEGLREIHSAVDSQVAEHAWVFIPEEKIWIDVTLEADAHSTRSDHELELYLSQLYPRIEEFHTHPSPSLKAVRHSPAFSPMNYLLLGTLPSAADLTGHYKLATAAPTDSRVVSGIVSQYGVTSYSMVAGSGSLPDTFTVGVPSRLQDDHIADPVATVPDLLAEYRQTMYRDFDSFPDITLDFKPI